MLPERRSNEVRILIVNADDFGLSGGVNEGIIAAHEKGIVTTTSLMVRWPAARDAAQYAQASSTLDVGLHLDLGEWVYCDERWIALYEVADLRDRKAVEDEVHRQIDTFCELVGRVPTHIDSHQHVHSEGPAQAVAKELAHEYILPLRHCTPAVRYCGDFYGQTAEGAGAPEYITVDALKKIFCGLQPGITELACHPGYADDLNTMYRGERRLELQTLIDPEIRTAIEAEGITLARFTEIAPPSNRSGRNR